MEREYRVANVPTVRDRHRHQSRGIRYVKMTEADKAEKLAILFKQKQHPDSWAMSAQILVRASEVLFSAYLASTTPEGEPLEPDDMRLNQPATLLYGYAMENAIKARIIEEKGWSEDNCEGRKELNSHDLENLLAKTSLKPDVTEEQKLLLKTLSQYVLWAGRYPASFDFKGKNGFIQAKQYDHASGECENMPPTPLDSVMKSKLDSLLQLLLKGI